MKRVFAILVFCLLACAAWLILRHGGEPPPVGASESEVGSASLRGTLAETATESTRTQVEAPADERPPPGLFGYRIRVIRQDNGEPVPGATLQWLPPGFDYRQAPPSVGREERITRFGISTTVDGEGRSTVFGLRSSLYVLARKESLYGQENLVGWDDQNNPVNAETEFTVEVGEEGVLRVRVVDGSGDPVAGVPVALSRRLAGDSRPRRTNLLPTNEEGLTSHKHAQLLLRDGAIESAAAQARMFGGVGKPVPVDLEHIPDDPIDVIVPPFGSLEVVLLGPDGRPWETGEGVEPRVIVLPENPGIIRDNRLTQVDLEPDGRVIVSPVLCGQRFEVSLSDRSLIETIDGPTRAGETVRVELSLPADTPLLVGRMVLEGGGPAPGHYAMFWSGDSQFLDLRADPSGRFRTDLPRGMIGAKPRFLFRRHGEHDWDTGEVAWLRPVAPIAAGTNDLGDIVVSTMPLLVSGRVEWGDGTPVPSPGIHVERLRGTEWEYWDYATDRQAKTDGTFVIRGVVESGRYRVRAASSHYRPTESVEFAPGTENLVLRTGLWGSVAATFLMDGGPHDSLHFRLTQMEGDDRPPPGRTSVKPGQVTRTWSPLMPGAYRLQVVALGTPDPLVDLTVEIPDEGGPSDDPRLSGIDLRGLESFTLNVTDSQGQPLPDPRRCAVLFTRADTLPPQWMALYLDEDGGPLRISTPAALTLRVAAPGFRTQDVVGVLSDTTVRLEPAPQITLRLTGVETLPSDVEALLTFAPASDPGSAGAIDVYYNFSGDVLSRPLERPLGRSSQRLTLSEDHRVPIDTRPGGVGSIELTLRRRVDGRLRRANVSVQPANVDLDRVVDGQVIDLRVDAAELAEALRALGG